MSDAWGGSFGVAWGLSWGDSSPASAVIGGHFVKEYRKKLKSHRNALEARELEKLAQTRKLREQIEAARHPVVALPVVSNKAEEKKQQPKPKTEAYFLDLSADLQRLERELVAIGKEISIEKNRIQDEHDVQAIMELLNKELSILQ